MKTGMAMTVFMALVCFMAMAASCGGEEFSDEDLRVFDGKVANVDTSKSVVTVVGGVQIEFPISPDTKIRQDTPDVNSAYDIKLSDIDAGDYVTVQYYRKGLESRVPAKVLVVTVQYKAKPSE